MKWNVAFLHRGLNKDGRSQQQIETFSHLLQACGFEVPLFIDRDLIRMGGCGHSPAPY